MHRRPFPGGRDQHVRAVVPLGHLEALADVAGCVVSFGLLGLTLATSPVLVVVLTALSARLGMALRLVRMRRSAILLT